MVFDITAENIKINEGIFTSADEGKLVCAYLVPVSYTHLDVYKRQVLVCLLFIKIIYVYSSQNVN